MARLIDADALNLDYEVEMADDWNTAHEMANLIKYAPTVEARPVVHGEWIKETYGWSCSICNESYGAEMYYECGSKMPNFCPNCGADMRKKVV